MIEGVSCAGWVGGNQPLLIPQCIRIVPDYVHGQGIATVTITNQEDMGPSNSAPLTLSSGGQDGLQLGLANYLGLVAGKGIGPMNSFT